MAKDKQHRKLNKRRNIKSKNTKKTIYNHTWRNTTQNDSQATYRSYDMKEGQYYI